MCIYSNSNGRRVLGAVCVIQISLVNNIQYCGGWGTSMHHRELSRRKTACLLKPLAACLVQYHLRRIVGRDTVG